MRHALAMAAALIVIGVAAAPAPAIVPPRDCGMLSVSGKRRYNVKADQLRCSSARTYSKRYLASHRRPSGYRCTSYGSETKL